MAFYNDHSFPIKKRESLFLKHICLNTKLREFRENSHTEKIRSVKHTHLDGWISTTKICCRDNSLEIVEWKCFYILKWNFLPFAVADL